MPTCPYEVRGTEEYAVCQKFADATGFICSVLRNMECKQHMAAGGWDVPLMNVPEFPRQIKARIIGRLRHGDFPMYQLPNPINILDAAVKLKSLMNDEERRFLLHDIADTWSDLTGSPDGHSAEVIETKLVAVAKAWNIESELAKWAEGIAR